MEGPLGGAASRCGAAGLSRSRVADADVLPRDFLARPSVQVAPDLLGCVISHDTPAGLVAVTLVEVEAYAGEADPASHAFRGRTARNAVMFGPPGHVYVYFTYGMHFCMNLVCEPEGHASAVLLRAGRVIDGVPLACARRSGSAGMRGSSGVPDEPGFTGWRAARHQTPGVLRREMDLARGPARLCQALGVDRSHDGADLCDPASPLRVLAPLEPVTAASISRGPRVGVSRAADVTWRFWITGEPAVSPYRRYAPRRGARNQLPAPTA
jgi:DNA-3-methyladenine glycosylase